MPFCCAHPEMKFGECCRHTKGKCPPAGHLCACGEACPGPKKLLLVLLGGVLGAAAVIGLQWAIAGRLR